MNLAHFGKILAALLVVPLLVAGVYFSSPERGLSFLIDAIERSTPYTVDLRDAHLAYRPFSFSASLVTLRDTSVSDAPLVAVQGLALQMPFTQLLFGDSEAGTLTASNVTYFFDSASSSEPLDFRSLIAPLSRLPAYVAVDSLHIISRDENVWIFPVTDIRGDRNQAGELQTSASVSIGQRTNAISAALEVVEEQRDIARILFNASISDPTGSSLLEIDGAIEGGAETLDYQASISGQYADVSEFVSAFDEDAYQFEGAVELEGTIEGDLNKYELSLSRLSLSTPNAYDFWATGTVAQSQVDPHPVLDLRAGGDASRLSVLLPIPATLSSAIRHSEFELTIKGTLDEPEVQEATLHLIGDGKTQLDIQVPQQSLALSEFREPARSPPFDAQFSLQSKSLKTFADSLEGAWPLSEDMAVSGEGTLSSDGETFTGKLLQLSATTDNFEAHGTISLRADEQLVSLPTIDLSLQSRTKPTQGIHVSGTTADLEVARGLALNIEFSNVELNHWAPLIESESIDKPLIQWSPLSDTVVDGEMRLQRASIPWLARDLSLTFNSGNGAIVGITGSAQYSEDGPEAELRFETHQLDQGLWTELVGTSAAPSIQEGKLRLRPRYVTLIAQGILGSSPIQLFANADLEESSATSIAVDLYSPELRLSDFKRVNTADATPANTEPNNNDQITSKHLSETLRPLLTTPLQITARADRLIGESTALNRFAIEVDASQELIVLRHFDTNYATGYLQLRGAMSLAGNVPAISLAGEGFRVPLGALTSDLGTQQSIEGELTLRGGLSSQGETANEWLGGLSGSIALAASDTTVSGAAYDQLMSNLLGWLVRGASERTTTFDCSMLQLQFSQGVATSNDVYIETPRMRATGKARIDLANEELDVRLVPRSKQRTIQFPSAVNIEGPLSDPEVRVSPLQATFDLSAQTLLLLPSLTLKLFGLGSDNEPLRPCQAALAE